MPGELVDPNFLTLIRSLKPYMGPRALQYTELAETILELLGTEQARKAQTTFQALRQERKQQKLAALPVEKPDRNPE